LWKAFRWSPPEKSHVVPRIELGHPPARQRSGYESERQIGLIPVVNTMMMTTE